MNCYAEIFILIYLEVIILKLIWGTCIIARTRSRAARPPQPRASQVMRSPPGVKEAAYRWHHEPRSGLRIPPFRIHVKVQ